MEGNCKLFLSYPRWDSKTWLFFVFVFFTFVGILRQSRRKTGARVTAEDDCLVHVEKYYLKKKCYLEANFKKKQHKFKMLWS